jgi:hypothetical protein
MAEPTADQASHVDTLTRHLSEEILNAIGLAQGARIRRLLRPLVWLPAHRFSELADRTERIVLEEGLPAGASFLLHRLVAGAQAKGADLIPEQGPLLVVSNHPGSVDGLAILSHLPRNDTKVVATGQPFFRSLDAARRHAIFVPREGAGRSTALREMLRHLEGGGSLMLFPGGNVEPDPAFVPGGREALARWSPSVGLLLRHVPQAQVLPAVVSSVLSPRWLRHPLVLLRHTARERQLLAEFLQGIQSLVFGRRQPIMAQLTFGLPVTAAEFGVGSDPLPQLIERVQRLLSDHMAAWGVAGPG